MQLFALNEIVIAMAGKPVAKLTPIEKKPKRRPGALKGKIRIAKDFDAPLPADVLDSFLDPIRMTGYVRSAAPAG